LLFNIYYSKGFGNVDEVCKRYRKTITYFNDTTLLTEGKTVMENSRSLAKMGNALVLIAIANHVHMEPSKTEGLHFNRSSDPKIGNVTIGGTNVNKSPPGVVRTLGLGVDCRRRYTECRMS
jgi:hypothetical protein